MRELTLADADKLERVLGDPVTMQHYPAPLDRAEVESFIRRNLARYVDSGFGLCALLIKDSGELIGDCGCYVREVNGNFDFELAWHVRRDLWGRGYATEAAQRCTDYAFENLGAERIIALVRPENRSSCRVAEKIGMSIERRIMWRDYDHCVYARKRA